MLTQSDVSTRLLYLFVRSRKKIGGNTKLSNVMVVAPIRSRMAPKFGKDRAITRSPVIQAERNSALLTPNTEDPFLEWSFIDSVILPEDILRTSSKNWNGGLRTMGSADMR